MLYHHAYLCRLCVGWMPNLIHKCRTILIGILCVLATVHRFMDWWGHRYLLGVGQRYNFFSQNSNMSRGAWFRFVLSKYCQDNKHIYLSSLERKTHDLFIKKKIIIKHDMKWGASIIFYKPPKRDY